MTTSKLAGLAAALAATVAIIIVLSGSTRAAPVCTEPPVQPAGAAALKPSDVLLAITAPRAGEALSVAPPSDSVTFAVDYWGPRLVAADGARAVDDYHLAYILDEDPSPYIGTLQALPVCDPRIAHTAATRVTFDSVARGSHALAVLLVGSNNVSVNPPVAARVTFTVR